MCKEIDEILGALSEVELMKAFYKAFSSRKVIKNDEVDDAYVVGNGGRVSGASGALVYISALPKPGTTEEKKLHQLGFCNRCEVHIQSTSKTAICPICDTEIDCT